MFQNRDNNIKKKKVYRIRLTCAEVNNKYFPAQMEDFGHITA